MVREIGTSASAVSNIGGDGPSSLGGFDLPVSGFVGFPTWGTWCRRARRLGAALPPEILGVAAVAYQSLRDVYRSPIAIGGQQMSDLSGCDD
jgi:hypothetical protein